MKTIAHRVAPLQLGEQRQHLALHRDVEGGRRLVEDEHLGPQDDGARDRDALALAARELVRIAVQDVVRARAGAEPDLVEHLHDQRVARDAIELGPVQRQAFADDAADRHARAERAERILEHDLDAPPHRAQGVAPGVVDARAVEHDRALGDRLQREQREAERRLARARLADDAERLAAPQLQGRTPHRVEAAMAKPPRADVEADANVARFDEHRRIARDRCTTRCGRLASSACV